MSWRTVVVSKKCKLTYKNNYMVVKNEQVNMIHLSEINTLVIDTTLVSITTMLLCELMNRKIKIIFCDEKHNPKGELVQYYGAHNTSKKVLNQINWNEDTKGLIWAKIVRNKILNQGKILDKKEKDNYCKLIDFAKEVQVNDSTNREGHSAKVYFNSLFGMEFSRNSNDDINSAMDYGYSIILSSFNREIVSNGYLTQLGIFHKNEFNFFNLSCDLMEPFRPLVDEIVYDNRELLFDKEYKMKLIDVLNKKVKINDGEYYVTNAIALYTSSVIKALDTGKYNDIYEVEVL